MNKHSLWRETRLGDILTYLDDLIEFDDMAEYLTITVKRRHGGLEERERLFGHEIKTKKQFRLHPGVFIISRVQCWHQAYAIVPDDIPSNMIASQNYDQFTVSPEIDKRFFWWLSHSPEFTETVRSSASGVVIEKMVFSREDWLEKTVLVPPLDEQRRIVERVEALASRIAKAQSLREEASQEVDYLYGREVAELFTNAKDWQTYNLGELTTDVSYGTSEKAHSERTGTPVFRMGNIQSGKLDLSDMKYMHPSQQELQKLTLQKGDILVNRTNSAELVGKCAVFDLEGDYLFASYIIRLRLDPQKANPYLVAEYINSPHGRAYMFAERKQMTGQANVNSQKLRALPIKLPPLDEQRRIVAYLDSVQARLASLRQLQSATGEELSALLPSVLDRAFKGEL